MIVTRVADYNKTRHWLLLSLPPPDLLNVPHLWHKRRYSGDRNRDRDFGAYTGLLANRKLRGRVISRQRKADVPVMGREEATALPPIEAHFGPPSETARRTRGTTVLDVNV